MHDVVCRTAEYRTGYSYNLKSGDVATCDDNVWHILSRSPFIVLLSNYYCTIIVLLLFIIVLIVLYRFVTFIFACHVADRDLFYLLCAPPFRHQITPVTSCYAVRTRSQHLQSKNSPVTSMNTLQLKSTIFTPFVVTDTCVSRIILLVFLLCCYR